MKKQEQIFCLKCKHYYATWKPAQPRGCRFYGFNSQETPSLVVKKELGTDCPAYELKASHKKANKLDLNDDSLW